MDLSRLKLATPVLSRMASKSTILGAFALAGLYTGYTVDPAHLDVISTAIAAVSAVALVFVNELPPGHVSTPVDVVPALVGGPSSGELVQAAETALASSAESRQAMKSLVEAVKATEAKAVTK